MLYEIYLISIVLITIVVIIYYYNQQIAYNNEVARINQLEALMLKQQEELLKARSESTPCPTGEYTTPRSCFFDSDYTCKWNTTTQRCDLAS